MEVSGQLHAPAALPVGKRPWCPLDRRLGGPQSRYGGGGMYLHRHKKSHFPIRRSVLQTLRHFYGNLWKTLNNEETCHISLPTWLFGRSFSWKIPVSGNEGNKTGSEHLQVSCRNHAVLYDEGFKTPRQVKQQRFYWKYLPSYPSTCRIFHYMTVQDLEVFTAMKIQVVVFWVVTPRSKVLRKAGILPHHYMVS